MAATDSKKPGFSNGRRWLHWLNAFLGTVALLAVIVMVDYLSDGHSWRFQLDRASPLQLSEQTHRVLDSLTNDVNITIFFDPHGPNEDIYSLTTALLTEYEQACPRHVHVKTLDYGKDVGAAKEFLAAHNLATSQQDKDFIHFECGTASKSVFPTELANYDFSDRLAGRSKFVRRSAFLGELFFTESIYDVGSPHPAKAYFLTGHGEDDPENNKDNSGYSRFAGILKNELNCSWEKLSLQGTNGVPADCQLLVVAASSREGKMLPEELDKIAAYLKQGGRLFALLMAPSGLEQILADWGVDAGPDNNRVMDLDKNVNHGEYMFLCKNLATNFITDPLISEDMPLLMVFPRVIGELRNRPKAPGSPTVTVLAATTKEGVNEARQTGMFPLMAEVEQGGIQGVGGGTRIVVTGDSDFLDDQAIEYVGNLVFAKRALSWLLQRPEAMLPGLGPRPIRQYKLYMTASQAQAVRWILLAGLPGCVLLLGGLVWLRRRS
jgi:hypothetical protein